MRRFIWVLWIAFAFLGLSSMAVGQERPANSLRVTEILPEDGMTGIPVTSAITVIFNRPVVPLMSGQAMLDLPQPVRIEPEVEGQGEWINAAVYTFRADDFLPADTTFTVTVSSDLQSVDGAALDRDYHWSFTTAPLQVGRVSPTHGTQEVLLNPEISVSFNQGLDMADAERYFYLRPANENKGTIPGKFEWQYGSSFIFRPGKLLEHETRYRFGFDTDDFSLAGENRWSFTTVGLPRIVRTHPEDGEKEVNFNYGGGFTLNFNVPMAAASFTDKITIEPAPERRNDFYRSDSYYIAFTPQPSTDYTITVAPGLKDVYGNIIEEGATYHFTTAPVPPNVSMVVPAWYGFYNAYNDTAGLFINHVNVDRIASRLYRVNIGSFVDILQSNAVSLGGQFYYRPNGNDLLKLRVREVYNQPDHYSPNFIELGEDGPLAPGIYFLQLNALNQPPEAPIERKHFMMVMTANLTVKTSMDKLWVWATDVQTGEPIVDVPISVYDADRIVVARGNTDSQGLLELDVPFSTNGLLDQSYIAVLQTSEHFGLGASNWANGIDPGMFVQQVAFYPDQYRIYAYTDRPIYRPDQTVYFRAIIRTKDDMTYTPPEINSVPVQIISALGEIVFDETLPVTQYGTINGEFKLAEDAPLGYYRLMLDIPESRSYYQPYEGWTGFSVAEYRLPEFQVNAAPQTDQVAQDETIRVLFGTEYYSGGAVREADVDYHVVSRPSAFRYTGEGYYHFEDYTDDENRLYEQEIAESSGVTDGNGEYLLEIPAALDDRPYTQIYAIEATIRDGTNQTVSGRTQVIVHPAQLYVGAQPERYVNPVGKPAQVNLIAVDWDSQPIADQLIRVEIEEIRWNNVQEMDSLGRTTWVHEEEIIPLTAGRAVTDDAGKATFIFTPPNAGTFRVRLSSRDRQGNETRSAVNVWVSGTQYVTWKMQNHNRIELIADREAYHVGDTAEILIASPFQGQTRALITVERAGVLQTEVVTMDTNSYVYRLPIQPDFAPNVFVSVMLVKGVDDTNPVATFRMGLIQLNVDTGQKLMNIEISADRDQAAPQETVHYTARTTDYRGEPVSAEVGVALTDLASLSLVDDPKPPLLDYFYNLQGIGVRTATPLTINTDELSRYTMDMIKGGGGGGGFGGVVEVREDFVDTPYWNATLVKDENGEASFEVTLPDNLTTANFW